MMWVIIASDGHGEGAEVAGVFDREPTTEELAAARRHTHAQYVRWERFAVNQVSDPLEAG